MNLAVSQAEKTSWMICLHSCKREVSVSYNSTVYAQFGGQMPSSILKIKDKIANKKVASSTGVSHEITMEPPEMPTEEVTKH